MGFEENKRVLWKILKGLKWISLYEGGIYFFGIKDEKQANGVNKIIFFLPQRGTHFFVKKHSIIQKINNIAFLKHSDIHDLFIYNKSNVVFKIIPIDGEKCVFNKPPTVNTPTDFTYNWVTDFATNKIKVKQAGPCDFLLITDNFYFFEFKTEAFDIDLTPDTSFNPNQANQHREKAEKQLARTITFFREQASAKGISLEGCFFAVLVTLPSFPRINASLLNRQTKFYLQFNAALSEITTKETYQFD